MNIIICFTVCFSQNCSDPLSSLFFSFQQSVKRSNFLLNLFVQPVTWQLFLLFCFCGIQRLMLQLNTCNCGNVTSQAEQYPYFLVVQWCHLTSFTLSSEKISYRLTRMCLLFCIKKTQVPEIWKTTRQGFATNKSIFHEGGGFAFQGSGRR